MRVCALILSLLAGSALAQTAYRIDDSATVVGQITTPMRWLTPGQSGGSQHLVQGQVQVQAKLNVQPWLGRPAARIYMGLTANSVPSLHVTWQTQGRFLTGTLRSASGAAARTLVYQGPITQARLEEVMLLTLSADGRSYSQTQQLPFFFEIEP